MPIPALRELAPDRAVPQGDALPGKATLPPAKATFSRPKSDTFAGKATVLARKATLLHRYGGRDRHKCQPPSPPRLLLAALAVLALAVPAAAKDSLGVFGEWGAFRDRQVPRCYAIAAAENEARDHAPFASVGTWPRRQVRGQVHVRLSRTTAPAATISLNVGGQRFALAGGGGDAWAQDRRMDAAIVAAMRSAGSMSVTARDRAGRRFTDRYTLAGAATALDAATVGCARLR